MLKDKYIFILRMALGFIFLWAFLDKTFGLGFNTSAAKSWLNGYSPTTGFLSMSAHGPFSKIYQAMAGSATVDWLFMLGLICISAGLIFGAMLRIAAWAGAALMICRCCRQAIIR